MHQCRSYDYEFVNLEILISLGALFKSKERMTDKFKALQQKVEEMAGGLHVGFNQSLYFQ